VWSFQHDSLSFSEMIEEHTPVFYVSSELNRSFPWMPKKIQNFGNQEIYSAAYWQSHDFFPIIPLFF
jgi:hypothetical protein